MSCDRGIHGPLWDKSTLLGRGLYFAWVNDPRSCLRCGGAEHYVFALGPNREAELTRGGGGGSLQDAISAQKMYESAFQLDFECPNGFGRMTFELPGGRHNEALLSVYKTPRELMLLHWFYQLFNLFVKEQNTLVYKSNVIKTYFTAARNGLERLKQFVGKGVPHQQTWNHMKIAQHFQIRTLFERVLLWPQHSVSDGFRRKNVERRTSRCHGSQRRRRRCRRRRRRKKRERQLARERELEEATESKIGK